jgi:hypothetical protein
MDLRGLVAALSASFTLMTAVPAAAQSRDASIAGPVDRAPGLITPRSRGPQFPMPEGDLRLAGEPQRNGLIAAVPVNRNLQIGIGRFRVGDIAQPRNHTENERHPGGMVPRQRSIAGLGLSLRFD